MATLTQGQLNQISATIQKHMDVVKMMTVGNTTPDPQLVKKLGLTSELTNLVSVAYKYGKLNMLLNKDLSTLTVGDINRLINDMKMSPAQKNALQLVQTKSQQAVNTLTQKIMAATVTAAIQSDLQMYQTIQNVIPNAIKNNTPRYQVIQQLREQSGDWKRDWHRVAQTEMWDAKLQGEAQSIMNGESPLTDDGGDTLVYKRPNPDCCPMCRKLYLEADGVTPKTFRLSDLMANGTNYGKKQVDWLPTLGTLHPHCQCTLGIKPKDTKFDKDGKLVYNPK